jgi:hypothetical protein
MSILASQLMATNPPTEEELKRFAELVRSAGVRLSQKMAETMASLLKESLKPRYITPSPILLPVQRQRALIVINLIVDLPTGCATRRTLG